MRTPSDAVGDDTIAEARSVLERGLGLVTLDSPARGHVVRIGAYQLAHGAAPSGVPFRWSAAKARRSIGLAAIRACLDGQARTPAEAVALVVSHPDGSSGVGRVARGSCADWLCVLSPPARAYVAAEATTWATRMWASVEWSQPDTIFDVGTRDRWWRWRPPAQRAVRVALRGRADVRIRRTGATDGAAREEAHLSVLDGDPTMSDRRALVLSALVDGLTSGACRVPLHVVGIWPDCGKVWTTVVSRASLLETARDALSAVRGLLSTLDPSASLRN